jgi:hypothetical protein
MRVARLPKNRQIAVYPFEGSVAGAFLSSASWTVAIALAGHAVGIPFDVSTLAAIAAGIAALCWVVLAIVTGSAGRD